MNKQDFAPGNIVKIETVYKFPKSNVASRYFPDGITPDHYLISADDVSNSRVTVAVMGIWSVEGEPTMATWNNPLFRLPLWHFDKVLVST